MGGGGEGNGREVCQGDEMEVGLGGEVMGGRTHLRE